ncbi:MAG TPA: CPXCG motif-containing cysteine-rich protein [Steroidobacteraceae bacterium]|nr:CPXCG motif-containing cysteine-rich protein [Steroidobacteraceae bacterium]
MASGKRTEIDRLYGLEPVIEPGEEAGRNALEQFVDAVCPYCGEMIPLRVDLSAGSQAYIEDCQVCCQPIQIGVQVGEAGALEAISAERGDR